MTDLRRRHHVCHLCGWETLTPASVRIVFHPCPGRGRRSLIDWLTEPRTLEEAFHSAFEDFAGGPQQLTEDELREETRPRGEDPDVCPRGHRWTQESTYLVPNGGGRRLCRICRQEDATESSSPAPAPGRGRGSERDSPRGAA